MFSFPINRQTLAYRCLQSNHIIFLPEDTLHSLYQRYGFSQLQPLLTPDIYKTCTYISNQHILTAGGEHGSCLSTALNFISRSSSFHDAENMFGSATIWPNNRNPMRSCWLCRYCLLLVRRRGIRGVVYGGLLQEQRDLTSGIIHPHRTQDESKLKMIGYMGFPAKHRRLISFSKQ